MRERERERKSRAIKGENTSCTIMTYVNKVVAQSAVIRFMLCRIKYDISYDGFVLGLCGDMSYDGVALQTLLHTFLGRTFKRMTSSMVLLSM